MGGLKDFFDDVVGLDDSGGIAGTIDDRILDPIKDVGAFVDDKILQPVLDVFRPDIPDFGDLSGGRNGTLINIDASAAPIPVVYGQARVGGIRRYIETTGTNNEFVHLIMIWSEGEIESVDALYIDDVISTDPKFAGLVQVTHHLGTDAQAADANMVAEIPWWTSAHKGGGIAYSAIRLKYDRDVFRGFPRFKADIKGRKCFDPRTGSTAWTRNPALIIRDYATASRFGARLPASDVDDAAVIEAADYCDSLRTPYAGGAAQALYACDGVIDTRQSPRQNLDKLRASCRGFLPFTGGLHTLVLDKTGGSEFSFNEDNIIGAWSIDWGGPRERMNRVTATYINPAKGWEPDTVVVDDATLRAQDGGRLLEKKVNLPLVTDAYRARDIAELTLKQSRQAIRASFTAAPEAMNCRIGRLCDITHSTPGWNSKLFRVTNLQPLPSGLVRVQVQEYDATVYDLSLPTSATGPRDTTLPDPSVVAAPTGVVAQSGTDQLVIGSDGSIVSRILVSWQPAADAFVDGYELQYKLAAESAWKDGTPGSNTSTHIVGVLDGATYDIRVRTRNTLGVRSGWASTQHTVIGKTARPPDVQAFRVDRQPDGTRQFAWDYPNPPADLAGFVIRYALGLGQPYSAMAPLIDGVITASPFESNQLAAGDYTFAIVAVDTTGNESANPIMISSTLGEPRIAGSIYTRDYQADGWPLGVITNAFVDNTGSLVAADQAAWSGLTTWGAWTGWSQTPQPTISYQTPDYDVGTVATFTPLVTAIGDGTIQIQEQHSTDGVAWSAWAAVGPVLTTRYIRFLITVTGPASGPAILRQASVNLSADPIEETLNDLPMTGLVGGVYTIPVTKTYHKIAQVNAALQGTGPGWTWEIVNRNATGPQIKIYDNGAAATDNAAVLIDAYIKGI